ncbi:MAG: histidinol dehydrogenase [Peptococcaceae bacterium]|nr:histidinol dehydrogenase [Peptococcaceae bacterium]
MIRIYDDQELTIEEILARDPAPAREAEALVAEIIADVRRRGDEALFDYCRRFDHNRLEDLRVSGEEIEEALRAAEPDLLESLELAAANIRNFHKRQLRQGFVIAEEAGKIMGQRVLPLERVGIYVPGGTAAYPSTVLMNAIPAALAGVERIVMASPASAEGRLNPAVLAAAKVAGVTDIYKIGGAQAVAALAYGTESVSRVDKIVGPGNLFVATAKRQVFGVVDIDMIAGPSEILAISDGTMEARILAADLLSQAEHDKNAAAVLITTSPGQAREVQAELERQIPLLPRAGICREAIDKNGKIILTDTVARAVEIANRIAPEHLELCLDDAFAWLPQIKHAGSVFLGKNAPEALGDYLGGPNHTLPTGGTARFSSPLSVDDFIKKSSFIYYSRDALADVEKNIRLLARAEGLEAHGQSVAARFDRIRDLRKQVRS